MTKVHILTAVFLLIILISAVDTTYSQNVDHASQILKELLPDKHYVLYESGITDSENYGLIIDFSLNKRLKQSVIIIDEVNSTFGLCCVSVIENGVDGSITEYFSAIICDVTPEQLSRVKELKQLFDMLVFGHE